MAMHSSILAWKSHGQSSLVSYSPWGCKESESTQRLKSNNFSDSFMEMEFTQYTVHPFKVYYSLVFNIFTGMCNHYHFSQLQNTSVTPKRNPASCSFFPPPPPITTPTLTQAITNLPPVPMDFPLLNISQELNYAMCDLLFLLFLLDFYPF